MDAGLDTLATELYVSINALLQQAPRLAPWGHAGGDPPQAQRRQDVTLAVMQALLGFTRARWP